MRTRGGGAASRRGRVRTLFAADLVAILLSLAGTYVLAEQIGPPAVIAPSWLLVALVPVITLSWLAIFGTYRLYEGQSRAIARKSFDEVSTLFNALLAGSLLLLVVGQGLKKGFDIFLYSPLEALFFLSLRGGARADAARRRAHLAAPEHDAPAAHADRGRRRDRPPARAQDRHPPRVRAGAGRLRRRRGRRGRARPRPPT